MAELAAPELVFEGRCPDCGERRIELPEPLPPVGDDFDWLLRDYDSFRLFMMQELAARFPERRRWNPADLEVVLVEVLAAVLDQLSDMSDRVASEAVLETARRPESVRRLLALIGYDAVEAAKDRGEISAADLDFDPAIARATLEQRLDAFWGRSPHAMSEARRAGPRAIHRQRRMVTVDDTARRLEDHPLVLRAHSWSAWSGSWTTVHVATINLGDLQLDAPVPATAWDAVAAFHAEHDLRLPSPAPVPSIRAVLDRYLEAYRMVGQEVVLRDAAPVPVTLALSVRVAANFFRSEIRRAVEEALGRGSGGFFEPGRLAFGEDLHTSDVIQWVMAVDGVESVCLNRFKRLGSGFPNETAGGRIVLEGLELAICDNDPARPERGYFRLTLHGGLNG